MPNQFITQRLAGLLQILNGVHAAGGGLSAAAKGQERQAFIDQFLSRVLPSVYRFGTGDITDVAGQKSGQIDVVIEYPFSPSLPIIGEGQTRLYLAESAAAAIEVKSNLSGQWGEAIRTSEQLAPLRRDFPNVMAFGELPAPFIPLFAVGYTGWQTMEALQRNVDQAPGIHGALVIDSALYCSKLGTRATGPLALWGLIADLHRLTNSLQGASTNPADYAR